MPMLEQHEVAAYLLERRLVSRRAVVAGHLRIADASSRNRNVRVTGGPGESYLLKQGLAADSAHTLANEAALYRRLCDVPWMARMHAYDAARGLLVLEWIEGGEDLLRRRVSPALAAALGRVLAELHAIAPDGENLRRDPPWVLALHRPPLEALRYLSAASVELVRLLQRDGALGGALDGLREGWRCEALVHRDVKRANCVAHGTRVALVDWEMAGWGDPAWDAGSVLGERHATPVAAAFWRAYVRARGLSAGEAATLLQRSLMFAGARIVQTSYEHAQEATALSEDVVRDIGEARELLLRPDAAAARLGLAA
jgi:aminoglycoside phosphotransferase (APT) family kinase protein